MTKEKYHQSYKAEEVESKIVDYALIKRLVVYLLPYKPYIALSLVTLIIAKIIESTVPIFIGKVTQKILDTYDSAPVDVDILFQYVLYSGLGIIGLLFFSYAMEAINVLVKSWVGQKALFTLRKEVYNHVLSLPIKYYDQHTIGRLMTRVIHDVDQINQMFSESLVPIIGNIILFVCIFFGIVWIDWRVAIAITCLMPMVIWHTNIFRKSQRKSFKAVRVIVSAMNTFMQEQLMGIAIVRKFGTRKRELKKFSSMNEDLKTSYLETIYNFSFFTAGIDFAIGTFLVSIFVLLVIFAPSEGFQASTYFALSLYSLMIFRPLSDLAERYNVLQSAAASAERIFNILDEETEVLDQKETDIGKIHSIKFDDVWFAYENDNWVLSGLSFEITSGSSVAFVGVTGAGKTTITSLLLRLYDHQKGNILINGHDIRSISKSSLRSIFSVVLQDPVIFSGSVLENIRLFDKSISEEQVNRAINYVNLRSYVDRWPKGINYLLTERGKELSVGEMQLISLARSIATERQVLILDEATANIDSKTEKNIQDALKKILHEKTTLMIAHRLSTIKEVTTILVIHKGRIVEKGSHDQLVKLNGIYEKLYRLQFH